MLEPSLDLPLHVQADPLGISRSSLQDQPMGPSARELAIQHEIDEIHTRWPFYGARRITVVLWLEAFPVSRPTVQRYMREMGIVGINPGSNASKSGPEHKVHAYFLRHVTAGYRNHVWGVDIA